MELDLRLLEALADAVIASDGANQIAYANAAAERLLGWTKKDLIGRPLTVLMPARMHSAHLAGYQRYMETRRGRIIGKPVRVPALHKDGTELDVELTLSTLAIEDRELVVATIRDLRERVELERQVGSQRHLVAAYGVMTVLTECKTFEEAAPKTLRVIAEALDWDVGILWAANSSTRLLHHRAEWASSSTPAERFLSASREMTFHPGDGIPGQVWQTQRSTWTLDVTEDPRYRRAGQAAEAGLRGAFFFPVFCAAAPHGVIEFLSRRPREPDANLLQTMATIGFQIGQFLERLRTEEALVRERDQLRHLFDQAPAAIAVIQAPEFRYLLSNPANQQLAGGRELVGRTVKEALPELESQGFLGILENVCRTRQPFIGKEVPLSLPKANGISQQLFLNGVYQPILDEHGAVTSIMAFAYEVTELVEARLRAENAERSTALVADALPQLVWTSDASGQPRFYNRRWFDYTGLSLEESMSDSWRRVCHPDDLPRLVDSWNTSLSSGQPFEGELRIRRGSDGQYRWHLVRSLPLKDERGRILRWVGSSTDIDDHKRGAERTAFLSEVSSLMGSSLDYQTTLKSLAGLVVPRLADWCAVYLQEPGEPHPRQLTVAHADPSKLQWAQQINQRYPPDPNSPRGAFAVVRTGRPEFYPDIPDALLVAAAKDEEHLRILREIGFSSAITVPLTARGRTFGAISLIAAESRKRYTAEEFSLAQAVADRAATAVDNARLYRDAQEAIRVRDDFLSVASHELRTPLTPLLINVQTAQRLTKRSPDQLPEHKLDEKLDSIARQVKRLERLVSSLLDVSRIAGNRLALDNEKLELTAAVREVVERFEEQARLSGVELTFIGDERIDGIWDRLRIEQIVVNLLSNALKFAGGKPIDVLVSADEDLACLIVRDRGLGIAPADQERIFGRFERAVSARHYGGLGLGLWLTRQLIEAMGGTIEVHSSPGKGSTFKVCLPRQPPQERSEPAMRRH